MSKFTHLHCHNEFSYLDGLGKAEHYVEEAKRLGFTSLALTNHGNVDGVIKHQQACEKEGIQPIIGCELYIVKDIEEREKGEKKYHMCAYVVDKTGWQNLLKMLTVANIDGFYFKPRVDPSILLEHSEGLLFTSACASTFIQTKWGKRLMRRLRADNRIYLELMPHDFDMQITANKLSLEYADQYDIPLIATNDCHYPTKEGALSQEVLLAMQSKAKWNDPKRWKFDITGLYLKTYSEMTEDFRTTHSYISRKIVREALLNTNELAERCKGFRIDQMPVELPKVKGYEKFNESDLLWDLASKGLHERIGEGITQVHKDRIREEYDLICELKFERYFLIMWELIHWCKANDILTGIGRGSVGGSLLAYCLYITAVDPIKYKLLFSRFISPARIDLPDIDMDFEDTKRDKVRKHLEDMYGYDCVSGLSTFSTLKGRAAVRDVSRVFDVPRPDVDAASKSIVVRSGGDFRSDFSIEDAFETFEDGIAFKKKHPKVSKIAISLEGQVRGVGMHAAAMCVSKESLMVGERCSLAKRKGGVIVANWDKYDAEYMGMMKLDILGLNALTVLNETKEIVKVNHGVDLVWDEIPLDDEKTYSEIIRKGHTVGCFQIGSFGLSRFCTELEVSNFDEIVHATSLWRPGTLRSGMTREFALRKTGQSTDWKSQHPIIEELTRDTYGIILYQEQVMLFMYELGGLGWKTCDTVRKVISKSQGDEMFMKFKKDFADGCVKKKTIDRKTAEELWDELSNFGSYGFNKSHAVEYSLISYWDAYLKAHYPKEFMASSLTHGGDDKKGEYVEECKRLELELELPKVGVSDYNRWITTPDSNKIYIPFSEIKGIGKKTITQIENLKKDKKKGFYKKNEKERLPNKTVLANFERMKVFDKEEFVTDEGELDQLSELFNFSLSKDPMHKVRGIHNMLKRLCGLEDIVTTDYRRNSQEDSKEEGLYMGKVTELKFGYKQSVLKSQKGGSNKGEKKVEGMGGIYGFIDDTSAIRMLLFQPDLYTNKKYDLEHCQGEWLLIKAAYKAQQDTLFCTDTISEKNLMECNFEDFKFKLIEHRPYKSEGGLWECCSCSLNDEVPNKPVPIQSGRYNVMIVGEAPSRTEDRVGECFIGDTGDLVWKELKKHNLRRRSFHVTNIVKCHPAKSKTPTKRHVEKCTALWLKKEIEQVKPVLILAFGNAGLSYFKRQEGGITNANGTTEWVPELNAWVCWCASPASAAYHSENLPAFREGIENFVRCYNNLKGE